MKLSPLLTLLVTCSLPAGASAQTWKTPDKLLSISTPDPQRFQSVQTPPPPFVAVWVSNDNSARLGVMKIDLPPGIKLIQSATEKGLAEQAGGEVTRLKSWTISGHEVWSMRATGPAASITQALIHYDRVVYKLMAVTVEGDPDEKMIDAFINSAAIPEP